MAFDAKAYQRQYALESRVFYKAHGICTRCGKEPSRPGKTVCLRCSFRPHKPPTREQRDRRNAALRAQRAERKAAGLCPSCGKPSFPGHVYCDSCRAYQRHKRMEYTQEQRKRYRERGLCIRCGGERVEGRSVCAACLEKMQQTALENFGPYYATAAQRARNCGWDMPFGRRGEAL